MSAVSIGVGVRAVCECAEVIILEAVVDPVVIAVVGENVGYDLTISCPHDERTLPESYSPCIPLLNPVHCPIAEGGLRHFRRGDDRSCGYNGRLIHGPGRITADRVAGETSQIHRDHSRIRKGNAAGLARVRISRIASGGKVCGKRDSIGIGIVRAGKIQIPEIVLLPSIGQTVAIAVGIKKIGDGLAIGVPQRESDLA